MAQFPPHLRSTLAALSLALATGTHAAPPNIVFFIADDVSQEDLGCYGHTTLKTPRIDALAAGGMRFDNAYLTTSSCSPSRKDRGQKGSGSGASLEFKPNRGRREHS